jgi:hypothetical protein
MKLLFIFLFALSFSLIQANPTPSEFLNDAVYVAQVKSFSSNGYLNCEFQCFLDMNYTNFENAPLVFFQLGTNVNPTAYQNIELNEENIVEKKMKDTNYKLKLNFGKIAVKKDFVARIAIVSGDEVKYVVLPPTNFNNSITIMNEKEVLENSGLCKAEQFLRKIDFDRLYKEYSYIEE